MSIGESVGIGFCVYERYEQVTCMIMKVRPPFGTDEYNASNLLWAPASLGNSVVRVLKNTGEIQECRDEAL
jgi:hypothetical protein